MYITLEQAKKHLLVDEDFRADDMYILDLIAVAEDSVSRSRWYFTTCYNSRYVTNDR